MALAEVCHQQAAKASQLISLILHSLIPYSKLRVMKWLLVLAVLVSVTFTAAPAYAQNNSERLQELADYTEQLAESVSGIGNLLVSIGEEIQNVAMALVTVLSNQDILISGQQNNTERLDDILDHTGGLSDMLSGQGNMLSDQQNRTGQMSDVLNLIKAVQSQQNDTISSVQESLDGSIRQNVEDNTETLMEIREMLERHDAYIQLIVTQLDSIESQVALLGFNGTSEVAAPPTTDSARLYAGKETTTVYAYDYKRAGAQIEGDSAYYDLNLRFVCTRDVYLDQISAEINDAAEPVVFSDRAPTQVNYVHVPYISKYILSSAFDTGTRYVEYHQDVDLGGNILKRGQSLLIETRLWDDTISLDGESTGLVGDSTVFDKRPVYTVDIDWRSQHSNARCEVDIRSSRTLPGLDEVETVHYIATLEDDANVLVPFDDTVTCTLPYQISNILTRVNDPNWGDAHSALSLSTYTLDGNNEDKPDTVHSFNADGTLSSYTGAFPFAVHDTRIAGNILGDNLLVSVTINTFKGGSCSLDDAS